MLDSEAEGGGPNRRNVWQDPYEGLPVPDVFPGGPSDTRVLTNYSRHVARYIYDSHERELISPVCNLGKVASFKHEELDKDWFKQKLKATRWNGDTSTFHLPCGELTVTLDDM
ncbi:hypothetical protein QL285_074620 [Trifolium repens]|nr:hypothetical protein QL285_074620 [Trifolium repens]